MHITDAACEALGQMLGRKDTERCLRLSTHQGKYRFVLDEPIEHDVIFRNDDRVILVVSETVSRDLWGITVDCTDADGKQRLIFRKAKQGEPLDTGDHQEEIVPPEWRASQHKALLEEIAQISTQITSMRRNKSAFREQLATLESKKQEKWDAIRALWAGDGGWHKLNNGKNGAAAVTAKAAD